MTEMGAEWRAGIFIYLYAFYFYFARCALSTDLFIQWILFCLLDSLGPA